MLYIQSLIFSAEDLGSAVESCDESLGIYFEKKGQASLYNMAWKTIMYEVCLKSKCTNFLFKCLLDSPEITSDLLQSMTLGKLQNGSNVFSTDHSNTGSHFL